MTQQILKIQNVSTNRFLISLSSISKYINILFFLSAVIVLLIPNTIVIFIFCGMGIMGAFIYVAPFIVFKNDYKHTLFFENCKIKLIKNNHLSNEYFKVTSVIVNGSEYHGQAIIPTFFNSFGLNKIVIKTKKNNYHFVFRINSKAEMEKLKNEVKQFDKESIYKIIFKNWFFI